MPQRRAGKKDLRKNRKRQKLNLKLEQKIKIAIKKFKKSLLSQEAALRQEALTQVYKILDKAAAKHYIHPNKAARKKSRLCALLKKPSSPAAQ